MLGYEQQEVQGRGNTPAGPDGAAHCGECSRNSRAGCGTRAVGSWRWHVGAQPPVVGAVLWRALAMLTAQHFRKGEEDQKLLSLA